MPPQSHVTTGATVPLCPLSYATVPGHDIHGSGQTREAIVLIVLSTAVDASNTLHTNAYSSMADIAEHNDVTETWWFVS